MDMGAFPALFAPINPQAAAEGKGFAGYCAVVFPCLGLARIAWARSSIRSA